MNDVVERLKSLYLIDFLGLKATSRLWDGYCYPVIVQKSGVEFVFVFDEDQGFVECLIETEEDFPYDYKSDSFHASKVSVVGSESQLLDRINQVLGC